MELTFEFDSAKSKRNKLKHGIDFLEAQQLWESPHILVKDSDDPREARHVIVAKVEDVHWAAVITYRGQNVRIISVRRARAREIEQYEDFSRRS